MQDQEEKVMLKDEKRSYEAYRGMKGLEFDPLKDLNLPASYEEAMSRYKRLRATAEDLQQPIAPKVSA